MATDYEQFYQENPHGLGEPFKEFVEFFNNNEKVNVKVLDLGCGQGRDALFIARMGHRVVGVDTSPTGIEQLVADAETEGLSIEGIVADIVDYEPSEQFDVVLIDRTLHMLKDDNVRLQVLSKLLPFVKNDGYILIADEKKNIPAMETLLADNGWRILPGKKTFVFAKKL